MAKDLPYFRFTVSEWLNGDIFIESPSIKGVFIDICAYYWFKDCELSQHMLNKRFPSVEQELKVLMDNNIIKLKNNGNSIKINFLDEQYKILSNISENRSKAGKASALKRATSVQQVLQHMNQQSSNYNYKYKYKDNNNTPHEYTIFNEFRTLYPGTKRGNETEFNNFKKKHKDWKEQLSKLKSAVEKQIEIKKQLINTNKFCPEWKNLQTWINNRCWEEEIKSPAIISTHQRWIPG